MTSNPNCICVNTCLRFGKPFPAEWFWCCQRLPYVQDWRPADETTGKPVEPYRGCDVWRIGGKLFVDLEQLLVIDRASEKTVAEYKHTEVGACILHGTWKRECGTGCPACDGLVEKTAAPLPTIPHSVCKTKDKCRDAGFCNDPWFCGSENLGALPRTTEP